MTHARALLLVPLLGAIPAGAQLVQEFDDISTVPRTVTGSNGLTATDAVVWNHPRALKVSFAGDTTGGTAHSAYLSWPVTFLTNRAQVRFWLHVPGAAEQVVGATTVNLMSLVGLIQPGTQPTDIIQLRLTVSPEGQPYLLLQTPQQSVGAPGSTGISLDTWHYVEVEYVVGVAAVLRIGDPRREGVSLSYTPTTTLQTLRLGLVNYGTGPKLTWHLDSLAVAGTPVHTGFSENQFVDEFESTTIFKWRKSERAISTLVEVSNESKYGGAHALKAQDANATSSATDRAFVHGSLTAHPKLFLRGWWRNGSVTSPGERILFGLHSSTLLCGTTPGCLTDLGQPLAAVSATSTGVALVGYDSLGNLHRGATFQVNDAGQWRLVELMVHKPGTTSSAVRTLYLDSVRVEEQTFNIGSELPDQWSTGHVAFTTPSTYAGVDFIDELRVAREPLPNRFHLSPTTAGVLGADTCVPLTVTAMNVHALPAEVPERVTVSLSSPSGTFFRTSACDTTAASVSMRAGTHTAQVYFRTSVAAAVTLRTSARDYLPHSTLLVFQDITPPAVPTGLAVRPPIVNGKTPVELRWAGPADAVSYTLRRTGGGSAHAFLPIKGTSATETVTLQGTYDYRVAAVDAAGNTSLFSEPASLLVDTTPPTAPGRPEAGSRSKYEPVRLTWTASTDTGGAGLLHYEVLSAPTGSEQFTVVGKVEVPEFTDPAETGSFVYQVRAVDKAGNASPASASSEPIARAPLPEQLPLRPGCGCQGAGGSTALWAALACLAWLGIRRRPLARLSRR